MRGWRRRASCREPERYQAWLGEIARREALRIHARRRDTAELDEARVPSHDPLAEPLARLALEPLLADLRPDERALLRLRFAEDLTYQELASRLDLPLGTAKVRLHRLQMRLRIRLLEAEWPGKGTTPE